MNTKTGKMGIELSGHDKIQPYRVWHRGKIIKFCYTITEARQRLIAAAKKNPLELAAVYKMIELNREVFFGN